MGCSFRPRLSLRNDTKAQGTIPDAIGRQVAKSRSSDRFGAVGNMPPVNPCQRRQHAVQWQQRRHRRMPRGDIPLQRWLGQRKQAFVYRPHGRRDGSYRRERTEHGTIR